MEKREWVVSGATIYDPIQWVEPSRVDVILTGYTTENKKGGTTIKSEGQQVLDRAFAVMALCPQHEFKIHTDNPLDLPKYIYGHFDDEVSVHIQEDIYEVAYQCGMGVPENLKSPLELFHGLPMEEFARRAMQHSDGWYPLRNVSIAARCLKINAKEIEVQPQPTE